MFTLVWDRDKYVCAGLLVVRKFKTTSVVNQEILLPPPHNKNSLRKTLARFTISVKCSKSPPSLVKTDGAPRGASHVSRVKCRPALESYALCLVAHLGGTCFISGASRMTKWILSQNAGQSWLSYISAAHLNILSFQENSSVIQFS